MQSPSPGCYGEECRDKARPDTGKVWDSPFLYSCLLANNVTANSTQFNILQYRDRVIKLPQSIIAESRDCVAVIGTRIQTTPKT